MKIIDATPPADFPSLVVVMDRALGQKNPNKTFYLRVAKADGHVGHVDLDGAVTPVDARRLAREKGYDPTHWMAADDARPMMY